MSTIKRLKKLNGKLKKLNKASSKNVSSAKKLRKKMEKYLNLKKK